MDLTLNRKFRILYSVEIHIKSYKGYKMNKRKRSATMKVIFLDIDGVLVTESHLTTLNKSGKRMTDSTGRHLFSPECVENLRKILDVTGAKIVLSSAWRMFGKAVFIQMWNDRKMPGEIIDFTPDLHHGRGVEIVDWLNLPITHRHDIVDSFVIIDDCISDMMIGQLPRIVKTTWLNGLTAEHADAAIQILNKSVDED